MRLSAYLAYYPCTELGYLLSRFTVYDFSKNNRMSYYPHNQPIVTSINQDEDEPNTVLQSATNTLLPTATLVDRNSAGSPPPELERSQVQPMAISRPSTSRRSESPPSDQGVPPRRSGS